MIKEYTSLNYTQRLSFLAMYDVKKPRAFDFMLYRVNLASTGELVAENVGLEEVMQKYNFNAEFEVIENDYPPLFQKACADYLMEKERRLNLFNEYLKARYLEAEQHIYHEAILLEACESATHDQYHPREGDCIFNLHLSIEDHYEAIIGRLQRILNAGTKAAEAAKA